MFLNTPWKSFYVNLPFEWLFVTFWKLFRSHAVTSCWLDDAKEFIQSGWSKQRDSCSLAQSWPRMLVTSKAVVFLENYLAVSTWILNGSSVECLEKKYQHFSLAGVRFGSPVNQISGLKSACRRSGLYFILRNNLRNQTNIFRLNVTLTSPRSQSCIIKSFLQG